MTKKSIGAGVRYGAYLFQQVTPHTFHVGEQALAAAAAFARQFKRFDGYPCREKFVESRKKSGIAARVGNAEKCCGRVLHGTLQFNPSGIVIKLLDDDA